MSGATITKARGRLAAGLLLLAAAAAAQDDAPRFVAHSAEDGPLPPAVLSGLDATWSLRTPDRADALPADAWVALRQDRVKPPPPLTESFVLLTGGDRWPLAPGSVVRRKDDRLWLRPGRPLLAKPSDELSLFPPYVAGFFLAVPEGVDDPERFFARLAAESRASDVALLKSGDRAEGRVTALDDAGCAVEAEGRRIVTPWAKLAGVAFATADLARPRLNRLHGHAVLAGGARARFTTLQLDPAARRLTGRTPYGATLSFDSRDLASLSLHQGRAVYLSELTPERYESSPYLGVSWPLGVDAAAGGGPLRLAGGTFDKGLGLHGRAAVTYRLDGQYRWFEAEAGPADPSPRYRPRFAVLVDGKRHDPPEPAAAVWPVRLDVRGAKELTLVSDFGPLGGVKAGVTWGDARVIK